MTDRRGRGTLAAGVKHACAAPRLAVVAGLAVQALLAGCHSPPGDKPALDGGLSDARPSDAAGPLTIDIAVTGCGTFDPTNVVCSGRAPMTLAFSPVGSASLTGFQWRFGDGSASVSDRAPVHTYALPGRYDVTVTGLEGTAGTVSATRIGLVVVKSIGAGMPCDVDAQCASGLACVCKRGAGCDPAFARGICSTPCPTGFCGDAVCAVYTVPVPAGAADAGSAADAAAATWSPICLASCSDGNSCPAGFSCQAFHAGGAGAAGWVLGCLPTGAASDLGGSCRNADGVLDNGRCASGTCAPFGANGLCSASCQPPFVCPDNAACARVGAAQVCLAACSAELPCASDPRTACQAALPADAGADGGLPIISGDPTQTYCAPR